MHSSSARPKSIGTLSLPSSASIGKAEPCPTPPHLAPSTRRFYLLDWAAYGNQRALTKTRDKSSELYYTSF